MANTKFKCKTNIKNNMVEVFIIFESQDFYEYIKGNEWKNHKENLSIYFKGYSDPHKAMKFVINPNTMKPEDFAVKLKKVINASKTLYDVSNISYDDYLKASEDRKRQNYETFMSALRGK